MRVITQKQFVEIAGKKFAPDSRFYPVLDGEGEIVISEEEVSQIIDPRFDWAKDLPEKKWMPVEIEK